MATSAKQAVNTQAIPDSVTDIATTKPRSKKKIILLLLALLVAGGGAGAAWVFWQSEQAAHPVAAKPVPPAPPVFLELETFTVNLVSDRILQAGITLQVKKIEDADQIKLYMPQVKSRLLLLLSTKGAEELNAAAGKKALADEIAAQLHAPYAKGLAAPELTGVFFTSFVIQ